MHQAFVFGAQWNDFLAFQVFGFRGNRIALKCCVNFCCTMKWTSCQFSSVQSLSHVRLFETPWIAARQASLSITKSQSSLRLTSIESVMPSNHLILCCPLLLLLSMFHSIKVFPNESAVRIRWPKYWSFSLAYRKLEPTENPFWKNIRRKQTNKNAS